MKTVIDEKVLDTEDAILLESDSDDICQLYDSKNGYLFIQYNLSWEPKLVLIDFDKMKPHKGNFPSGGTAIFLGTDMNDKNGIWVTCSMFNKIVDFKKKNERKN